MNKVMMAAAAIAVAVLSGCRTANECTCYCGMCKCVKTMPVCTPQEIAEGFVPLFNGVDFEGWDVSTNGSYVVEPGGVLAYRHELGGSMWTKKNYRDFNLRFEFRLSCDCNNGLGVRVPKGMNTYNGGFELQIIDDEGSMYKGVFPQLGVPQHAYQRHGAVYGVVPPKVQKNGRSYLKRVGEWNTQEVEMHGSRLKVWLNGTLIQDCDLDDYPIDGTSMDHAKHPGIRSREGRFGWLSHGYPCWWRNIRIKEFKEGDR